MRKILTFIAVALAFAACHNDSYETGQGTYSLTQADFVEAHTLSIGLVTSVVTDEGLSFSLSKPVQAKWASNGDSAYRALLYYNNVGDGVAEPISMSQVPTLHPAPLAQNETIKTDPVKFESAWVSKSGKYLNLGLYMKVGKSDNDSAHQTIGMVYESTTTYDNGRRTAHLRFYHDQGDVPQYYSSRYYVSVPCKDIDADTVEVSVFTYDGVVVRSLPLTD